jgi:hypothetical protein
MLFRIETIPHRDRKLFGKCRACKRHSTYKIKLHKLVACLRFTGKYEWEEKEVYIRDKKGKKTTKTEKKMVKTPVIVKEFRPIGKHPYLLCSRRCIVLAQLAFL